ncbi:CobW family GTP-binding protein [Cytobacillus gottheilii]|uniref:CobW family GTP-binding protein n=1 Tax=Cytobacillus gottheilii TaxID=859144 RepID=UPI0009B96F1C|nr:GTP-binding protein [Cytobacillus gottheilii]
MNKTEIYILSGFLGSGKTTLLKQLLLEEKEKGRKTAVLMNELGKVSIDSDAVDTDVPLKELLDGCICCTIQDKLEAQLQELLVMEKPEVIYIESTGAAHPIEVLDGILSPIFADQLWVKGIISVLDGQLWLERSSLSPQIRQLLVEQVKHSDLLLLNKADQLTEAQQGQLVYDVQAINPNVLALLTTYSKVPMEKVRNLSASKRAESETAHVKQDLNLGTFVYTFKRSVHREGFINFLQSLPDTIYRIKGYIQFTNSPYPELFQYSYGMPIFLPENMKMPLNMVFIGEQIDWQDIQSQLETLSAD